MACVTADDKQPKAAEQLRTVLDDCGITEPQGRSILEIGFKQGLFLQECRLAGFVPVGLEIEPQYCDAVRARMPELDVRLYDGVTFPLRDAEVDFVVSFQVLEHVADLDRILVESFRVLKPGGIAYHVCPNYRSFYEGHYRVVWLPFLNRYLGRLYLRLLGRYTPYYEKLNLITPGRLRRFLHARADIEVLSLGRRQFADRFTDRQTEKIAHPRLRRLVHFIARHRRLKKTITSLATALDIYYPITLICRKKSA